VKAGWATAELAKVAKVFTDGNWIETKDQASEGIRLVQTGNVGEGVFKDRRDKARFIDHATFNRLNCFEVLPGDCLISRLPDPVGRACIVPDTGDKMITAVDCSIVRVDEARVDRNFLVYFTLTDAYLQAVDSLCSGTTRSRISRSNLGRVTIPLPPLEEQQRIVAVLDEAFEGLTRARAHAEANLQNARELFANSLLNIFDGLEATAPRLTLAQAATTFGRGKSRHRPRNAPFLYGGNYPFVQTGDIRNSSGTVSAYTQTYSEHGLAQSKLWPAGTVCITIAANIAETAVLGFDACFPDSIIGMVANPEVTFPEYVEFMLRYFAAELKALGKGSAQDNINLATFETATFPFPDIATQVEIVEKLVRLTNVTSQLTTTYETKLQSLDALRQSLLQKAFAGELTDKASAASTGNPDLDAALDDVFATPLTSEEIAENRRRNPESARRADELRALLDLPPME
jgi:type I restriction enzyme S subunit